MPFDKVNCQLCAKLSTKRKLIDLESEGKLEEITAKLCRINALVHFNDDLPKTVCLVCSETLNISYDFVVNVERAQNIIRKRECLEGCPAETNMIEVKLEKKEEPSVMESENTLYRIDGNDHVNDVTFEYGEIKVEQNSGSEVGLEIDKGSTSSEETWATYGWLCKYCDTQFCHIDELRTHSMAYHDSCIPYRCRDCISKKDSLRKFIIHIKKHRQHLKLSCFVCYKPFSRSFDVQKHYDKEHKKTKFICGGCSLCFENEDELDKHKASYMKRTWNNGVTLKGVVRDLKCPQCGKTFSNHSTLKYHKKNLHMERTKDYTCDQCGKCFYHRSSLETHIARHNSERPFKCKICKFGFKSSPNLINHMTVHNDEKPHKCEECGKTFRLKHQLRSHAIVHTDLHPFKCQHCDKRFRFKTVLTNHERIHLGVKPYACDLCQKDFTNWSNFNKHMKRKHNKNMAKEKNIVTLRPISDHTPVK